jgi:hypothetical protein
MALNLQSPNSMSSYSMILFVHLSVSLVNCSLAAYLRLILDGEISMAAASAPALPHALSQYINHGDSSTGPSVYELGSAHSAIKSAMICDFTLLFLKSTTCSDNSIAHLLIWPDESLLPKISFKGWFVNTRIM